MINMYDVKPRVAADIAMNLGIIEEPSELEGKMSELIEATKGMSFHDLMDKFLTWNGIIGWTATICTAYETLRASEVVPGAKVDPAVQFLPRAEVTLHELKRVILAEEGEAGEEWYSLTNKVEPHMLDAFIRMELNIGEDEEKMTWNEMYTDGFVNDWDNGASPEEKDKLIENIAEHLGIALT